MSKKKLQRIKKEKGILKNDSLDVRRIEKYPIARKLQEPPLSPCAKPLISGVVTINIDDNTLRPTYLSTVN